MKIDLAQLTRRSRPSMRRRAIDLRDIVPPAVLATDLYRASYAPVVAIWQRALQPILAEYERTLATMTTDAPADIQARIDAAQSEFERLFLTLQAALEQWGIRVERWQRERWVGAVLTATGVDLGTLIGPEGARETVERYLRWNVALIRDVSAQAQQRISSAVFAGLQNRSPVHDVAKAIREAVEMSRRRSIGIASDQLSKVTSALADERRREAGLSIWRWRHSGKRHPREEHRARDGKLYSDAAADVGREVEGQTVSTAPDESDRPGRPPYCGCRSQSVLVFD